MPQVPQQEVAPGLVVHLDTTELRKLGGSQTNAENAKTEDRAVQGPHYFLILEVTGEECTAVPLFSAWTPGAKELVEAKKSGLADKWTGQSSFFNCWQHWRIPVKSIELTSGDEESTSNNRRRYASGDRKALEDILAWQERNRAPYRAA